MPVPASISNNLVGHCGGGEDRTRRVEVPRMSFARRSVCVCVAHSWCVPSAWCFVFSFGIYVDPSNTCPYSGPCTASTQPRRHSPDPRRGDYSQSTRERTERTGRERQSKHKEEQLIETRVCASACVVCACPLSRSDVAVCCVLTLFGGCRSSVLRALDIKTFLPSSP